MAERRLAIAIKGGVSLGAYEAGVIAETLFLLDYNNQNNTSVKWYVDALAGASAGGMTSAVLAMMLLNGSLTGAAPDDDKNLLKKVWVKTISLDVLDPANKVGLSDNFMFASGAIDKIAGDNIKFPSTVAPHRALRDARGANGAHIALALTHSRLGQGLQAVPTFTGTEFFFNEHAALSRFDIRIKPNAAGILAAAFTGNGVSALSQPANGTALDSGGAFAGMISCAIACGAFPFAFAPRALALMDDQNNWSLDYFTDGGLYDNDPVGQAINLAHEIDWGPDADDFSDTERRYLTIEPEPGQDPDNWPPAPQLLSGTNMLNVDPLTMVGRILGGALQELQQSGVRGIPEVNRRVKIRQDLIAQLEYYIHVASGDLALPSWLPDMVNDIGKSRGLSTEQMNYFRAHFIPDLEVEAPVAYGGARSLPPKRQQLFAEFGLLIDLAMDVTDKVAFEPILVNPKAELAGDPLYAFKGFFDVRIRQHDFAQGIADALEVWQGVQGREGRQVLKLPNRDLPPMPAAPDIGDADLDRVKARLETIINSAIGGLPDLEKLYVKAALQWQINLFLGSFLKSLDSPQ
jgi:predicted acylesterase/phospholipase RssA